MVCKDQQSGNSKILEQISISPTRHCFLFPFGKTCGGGGAHHLVFIVVIESILKAEGR